MPMTVLMLAGVLAAGAAAAEEHPAAPVVAAERAFAADGLTMGVDGSFLKHSTPDAIMISAAPARAHEILDHEAVFDPSAPSLVWFPAWAGVSRDGGLGFTSGPVEVGGNRTGHYFTVWKKQPDGGWKWVYDGGTGAPSRDEPGPEAPVTWVPVSSVGAASPEAAMDEVRAAEADFAARSRDDAAAALRARLAPEARLYVAPLPPGKDAASREAAMAGLPAAVTFGAPMGGGASDGGDLVWVYGTAAWSRDGADRTGHYVRLWQKRPDAWQLVFAQVIPAPPPQPAAQAPTTGG